jgi:hypothetical protein
VQLFKDFSISFDGSRLNRGWINLSCPYCGSEGSTHFGINVRHDYATCFVCGGHSLHDSLRLILNVPSSSLDRILEPYQRKTKILQQLNKKETTVKNLKLPGYPLSFQEKKYLFDRHFYYKDLEKDFNIQGGGWIGDWKNRIIIPIYIGGKLVSWTSRTILPDRVPRYKNLANELSVIPCKETFFNLDNCPGKTAVLLEGPFDVLRFGLYGLCGFGITLKTSQIMYLSNRFTTIYILFDNERKAQKKAKEYGMLLQGHGLDIYIVNAFSDYGVKDAGEMSPFNMKKLKKELGLVKELPKKEYVF